MITGNLNAKGEISGNINAGKKSWEESGITLNATIDTTLTSPTYNLGINRYITSIKSLDVGTKTSLSGMFSSCEQLVSIGLIDTSNVENFSSMFFYCQKLEDVPIFDASSGTSFENMFFNCSSLTERSLDNILQMCISATSYEGTKTLNEMGIRTGYGWEYATETMEALPHYQEFIAAGWTLK